jgi:hypothetical protein
MGHLVKGEVRLTAGNHHRATVEREPPVPQLHLVCGAPGCEQSVCCLSYDVGAGSYLYTLETLVSLVGAHVLQCHSSAAASLPAQT